MIDRLCVSELTGAQPSRLQIPASETLALQSALPNGAGGKLLHYQPIR
jgi:hypothetical protein